MPESSRVSLIDTANTSGNKRYSVPKPLNLANEHIVVPLVSLKEAFQIVKSINEAVSEVG